MHAFSIVTLGIFVAGYSTARWDLTTRLYELAIFAWDHGVVTRAAKGFAILSLFFFLLVLPFVRLATEETDLVGTTCTSCEYSRTDSLSIHGSALVAFLRASSSNDEGLSSGVAGW
jgi:hypothetical protein